MNNKKRLFSYNLPLFSIIIFLLFISAHNYILIKLKKFQPEKDFKNDKFTPEDLIKNLFNQYYTILTVGNPPQEVETQISIDYHGLIMKGDICLTSNYYNKNISLSLTQNYNYDYNPNSKKIVIANENIDFPVYNTTIKIYPKLQFKIIHLYMIKLIKLKKEAN